MNSMKHLKNIIRMATAFAVISAVTACGGGGGDGTASSGVAPPPNAPETGAVSNGVAAVGAPIVGGQVTLKCASGATAAASTGADGGWTVSIKSGDYPCLIRVAGGRAGGEELTGALYSVASGAGVSNITPLTDLIVAALNNQDPGSWFDSATNGSLSGAISAASLSAALDKVKTTIATLPGKLSLPEGFDPITTSFVAEKGNAADDLLEVYGLALTTAGVTQSDAGRATSSGTALTKEAYKMTAYTTPNLTGFVMGSSKNLDDSFSISIPDPNRGNYTAKGTVDADGNLIALASDTPFNGVLSVLGNRIGQLCTANVGGFNPDMASQYVYVSSELQEVTDPSELYGKKFTDYEDCATYGTSEIRADGAFIFTETASGNSDEPDTNFAQALTRDGLVDEKNGSVIRVKAYKHTSAGVTTYAYLLVSTKQGSTTPALNGETDYVTIGVSLQP